MSNKHLYTFCAFIFGLTLCGAALATPSTITMNFDGFTNAFAQGTGEYVDDYYNGGCGSAYSAGTTDCSGPTDGAVWVNAIAGPAPSFFFGMPSVVANEPSSPGVMYFQSPDGATMNVAAGFTGSLSFYYATNVSGGVAKVYSGANGSGTLLGTSASLSAPGGGCGGSSALISCWDAENVTFSGIARSVEFNIGPDGIGSIFFDDVSFTPAAVSVPEPGSLAMLGLGLLGLGFFFSRRHHAKTK